MNEEIEKERRKIEKIKGELKKIKKDDLIKYYLELVGLLDSWFYKYDALEISSEKHISRLKGAMITWVILSFFIGLYIGKFIV